MTRRIATKVQLERLNREAIKGGGNALTDEFFEQLPDDLKYLVDPWLVQNRGWHRCFVYYSHDKDGTNFDRVWLDIEDAMLEMLPEVPIGGQTEL